MPFNLSDDEFDLPADLQELGDRLSQESHNLAQIYPAGAVHDSRLQACAVPADFPVFPASPMAAPRPMTARNPFVALASAATGLAALLAVGLLLFTLSRRESAQPAAEQAAVAGPNPGFVALVAAPGRPPQFAVLDDARAGGSPATVGVQPVFAPSRGAEAPQPAVLLNASGPQLEGLFDLWERESPQVATVSF